MAGCLTHDAEKHSGPQVRVISDLGGAALLLAAWLSVLRTVFIPRRKSSRVARWTTGLVAVAAFRGGRGLPRGVRERLLGLGAPVALFGIVVVWLAAGLAGFALLAWGLAGMPWSERGMATVFALNPSQSPEGFALGGVAWLSSVLLIAAFTVHLIGVTDAYNRRERPVSRLAAQAVRPVDAEAVIASYLRSGSRDRLDGMFGEWAAWFADLEGTHLGYPVLVYYRQAGQLCWVKAAVIVLDCAALTEACAPGWAPPEGCALLAVGSRCLQGIATQLGVSRPRAPVSYHGREAYPFNGTLENVRDAGLPMTRSEAAAQEEFQRLRIQYAPFANAIAERLLCDLGANDTKQVREDQ